MVFDHDDVVVATSEAEAQIDAADGKTTARLQLDGASLKLELIPVATAISLGGEGSGGEELSVCRVLASLDAGGKTRQISCLGIRSAGIEPEPADASLTRSIAVAFSDGGILAAARSAPREAQRRTPTRRSSRPSPSPIEPTRFEETLLSTQYDGEGRQVRATLELWPEQDSTPRPARRAAGTIVCGTSLALAERRLDVAIFRWSMEGKPGLGRYEVLSPLAPA